MNAETVSSLSDAFIENVGFITKDFAEVEIRLLALEAKIIQLIATAEARIKHVDGGNRAYYRDFITRTQKAREEVKRVLAGLEPLSSNTVKTVIELIEDLNKAGRI